MLRKFCYIYTFAIVCKCNFLVEMLFRYVKLFSHGKVFPFQWNQSLSFVFLLKKDDNWNKICARTINTWRSFQLNWFLKQSDRNRLPGTWQTCKRCKTCQREGNTARILMIKVAYCSTYYLFYAHYKLLEFVHVDVFPDPALLFTFSYCNCVVCIQQLYIYAVLL